MRHPFSYKTLSAFSGLTNRMGWVNPGTGRFIGTLGSNVPTSGVTSKEQQPNAYPENSGLSLKGSLIVTDISIGNADASKAIT